jgi:hypothetical protein
VVTEEEGVPGGVVTEEEGVPGGVTVEGVGSGVDPVPKSPKVHLQLDGKFDAEIPQQDCGAEVSLGIVTSCQIVEGVDPNVVEMPSALKFNHPGFACGH